MKGGIIEELRELLNHPQRGLKESSDTNKNRTAILGLFEKTLTSQREEFRKMVEGKMLIQGKRGTSEYIRKWVLDFKNETLEDILKELE